LETTKNAPSSLGAKLKFMGPGMVLAALAIGSGELVLTPRSGAQYGFVLLWVPILTIAYKAAFSEGLARLTIASGNDVFAAFDWLGGPRHWAQYSIILVFSLDMIGYGGIALAGGSALAGLFPGFDIRLGALLTAALVPVLLCTGSYPFFEKVVIAMCAVLLAGVIYTLFQIPLPGEQIARGLVPTVPKGSVSTIMGLMGWVGAGTTTLLYSTWINEKIGKARNEQEYTAPPHTHSCWGFLSHSSQWGSLLCTPRGLCPRSSRSCRPCPGCLTRFGGAVKRSWSWGSSPCSAR